ncbi:MAG: PAS domain S-box protein [Sphingobacteriaceae bacterium]|nr:MAG: PAS domain S-box protein [Sphingobacteriaceae bacterium]
MDNDNTDYKKRLDECEDRFNRIFDLSSAPSKIIDPQLTILRVNQGIVDLLGYTKEEIVGTKILDYACSEYIQHWHELQEALWLRKLPLFKLEACLHRKDKSIAWVNVTTILFEDQGKTFGFTVFDDITYRKEFEESEKKLKKALARSEKSQGDLRQSEQHIARILETMAEGVITIDLDGKITYANKMAYKIFGLDDGELLERSFYDTQWHNLKVDGTPLSKAEHPISVMMSTGSQIFDQEYAIQPPVGDKLYISINAAPIRGDDGALLGGIGTFMDVTNRRLVTQQKDDFISVASHELKTPLTTLKATLQILTKMHEDATETKRALQSSMFEQANRSLNKVNTLVADLLNASRMNDGHLILDKKLFNITDLINDCCEHIKIAGYEIIIDGDKDLLVNGDPDKVDQVLVNFVNNAVKYAPESKVIHIRLEKFDDMARVSVTDTGPGIPINKQQQLFDRYFRVDSSGLQYSGLGLGLYINAEIIKRHGGEIGVISELGKGSTFWFTLPLS